MSWQLPEGHLHFSPSWLWAPAWRTLSGGFFPTSIYQIRLLHMFISGWQIEQAPCCCLCLLPARGATTSADFFHYGTPHQNRRKQCGNQRGGLVWAVSLQLLLMSCNLEQREAMPAQGNCCCLVHSPANGGGGGIRSSVLISKRTKEAEGDSVKDDLCALPT